MCHIWKNGSQLQKGVTLGKRSQKWESLAKMDHTMQNKTFGKMGPTWNNESHS